MFLALGIFGFPFGVEINRHGDLHECFDECSGFGFAADDESIALGCGNPTRTVYATNNELGASRVNVSNDDEQFSLP